MLNKAKPSIMKKIILKLLPLSVFSVMLLFSTSLFADNPPDPGGDPTGDPVGGGSPVGEGIVLLVTLASAYGGKKFYDIRKKLME